MNKPLGHKNYGHILHLPGSRMGDGDHHCHEGQARICTVKTRDKHDRIIVTEKLDGSNCGIARIDDRIVALTRAGYLAETSKYEQHHMFSDWVMSQQDRWLSVLKPGQRFVGEWLAQAHGTRYYLQHEPFVVFDLFEGKDRLLFKDMMDAAYSARLRCPQILSYGPATAVDYVMGILSPNGFHGALNPPEGAVWRVERNMQPDKQKADREWRFDFMVKYVRPGKIDGSYLPEMTEREAVWNWRP